MRGAVLLWFLGSVGFGRCHGVKEEHGSKLPQCQIDPILENLASSGVASQSSQYNPLGQASNALDRNRQSNYMYGSCIHTHEETDPWWMVELLDVSNVTSVIITNRGDCCHTRIAGAEIRVGNDSNGASNPLCAVITNLGRGETKEFECGEMEGRYVTVILPGRGKTLALCEVEVHGEPLREELTNTKTLEEGRERELLNRVNKDSLETQCQLEPVPENLASSGKASQSSTTYGRASNAIDRKRQTWLFFGSCTHTGEETDPWWRVELQDIYNITSVTITNRGDCCHTRIAGAEIRIGNDIAGSNNPLCAVISELGEGETKEFGCGEMEGRYVTVVLPGRGKILTLCEVEVHGKALQEVNQDGGSETLPQCQIETIPENPATFIRATQSSQYNPLGEARNAIDRNRLAIYSYGSCTHTNQESSPWWRGELPGVYSVASVSITNRGDCCHTRIAGAEIRIGNDLNGDNNPLCAVISELGSGETKEFACGSEMKGRYVAVVLPGRRKYLALCEVEVHGKSLEPLEEVGPRPIPEDTESGLAAQCRMKPIPENLASFGRATQSSVYSHLSHAGNALDRKRHTWYSFSSCSHTLPETDPWWRVELQQVSRVSSVTITNRGDCCHTRIAGAEIRVGNDIAGSNNPLCAVISELGEGETKEFGCGEMEGRYVTVVLPGRGKILTLCEVEVHGKALGKPEV